MAKIMMLMMMIIIIIISEMGRRSCAATGDARETAFLLQRISVALQRFNAVLIHVFCRTRRRAGPLAIPTCVLASVFSPLAFYTIIIIISAFV